MSQTQQTYSLRKEIGFGVELALSALGEPHQIQIEDQGGAYDFEVITTQDPLASLAAQAAWVTLAVTPGMLTAVPAGVRKLAVRITAINNPDAPKLQVFHLPGFFRGTENARYYGVDSLLLAAGPPPPPFISEARDFQSAKLVDANGPYAGVTATRFATVSFWFNTDVDNGNMELLRWSNLTSQFCVLIHKDATNRLGLFIDVSTGVAGIEAKSGTNTALAASGWQHFMCSVEHAFPVDAVANITAYLDGNLIVDNIGGANIIQQPNDFDFGYVTRGQRVIQAVNGNITPSDFYNGCLSNFYLNTDTRIDLTIQANREKFRSATGGNVNLGSDGSIPTGMQPFLFAANGDLQVNDGFGPNLVVSQGSVIDCGDAPPTP